jgi:methylmalonyl-CoA/ethylmalonyl-CoA epimerase
MSASPLAGQPVCQVGVVVRDIQRSARAYAELLGQPVPEVIVTAAESEAHTRLRGAPTPARAKLAFFKAGSLSLELIEPIGGPSTWQEFLDTRGEGVHHLAFQVEDTDRATAALAERGIPVVQQGDYTGGRYTYLGSEGPLAVILELLAPR